jgi:outer membrane lipopolysaccharide assembly protein LptE/RlpB
MKNARTRSLPFVGFLAALVLAGSGCGYHAAGKGTNLPTDLHTLAIPAFRNRTNTYRVEQKITEAVVHEFTSRTNYRLVYKDDGSADATLDGVVTATQFTPITYDSTTGRVSSALVTVSMSVKLVDRKGKVLFENAGYTFREQYQISGEVSSFFEEESPAMDRMVSDFARSLVSNILEAY